MEGGAIPRRKRTSSCSITSIGSCDRRRLSVGEIDLQLRGEDDDRITRVEDPERAGESESDASLEVLRSPGGSRRLGPGEARSDYGRSE